MDTWTQMSSLWVGSVQRQISPTGKACQYEQHCAAVSHPDVCVSIPKQRHALCESLGILQCRWFGGPSCLIVRGNTVDVTHPEERGKSDSCQGYYISSQAGDSAVI